MNEQTSRTTWMASILLGMSIVILPIAVYVHLEKARIESEHLINLRDVEVSEIDSATTINFADGRLIAFKNQTTTNDAVTTVAEIGKIQKDLQKIMDTSQTQQIVFLAAGLHFELGTQKRKAFAQSMMDFPEMKKDRVIATTEGRDGTTLKIINPEINTEWLLNIENIVAMRDFTNAMGFETILLSNGKEISITVAALPPGAPKSSNNNKFI